MFTQIFRYIQSIIYLPTALFTKWTLEAELYMLRIENEKVRLELDKKAVQAGDEFLAMMKDKVTPPTTYN